MPDRRRESDRVISAWLLNVLVICALLGVVSIMVTGLTSAGLLANREQTQANKELLQRIDRIQRAQSVEGRERRDQTCTVFERDHLKDVEALRRSYAYLAVPHPGLEELDQLALAQVPRLEQDAFVDKAPPYCDEPGVAQESLWARTHGKRGQPPVGLTEPDPVLPCRPKRVEHRLPPIVPPPKCKAL